MDGSAESAPNSRCQTARHIIPFSQIEMRHQPRFMFYYSRSKRENVTRWISQKFPESQHRIAIMEIAFRLQLVNYVQLPHWKFKKTNWISFSKTVDDSVFNQHQETTMALSNCLQQPQGNISQEGFVSCMFLDGINALRKHLSTISKISELTDELITALDNDRRQKWTELIENMNFQKRQARNLLRKVHDGKSVTNHRTVITTNVINNVLKDKRKKCSIYSLLIIQVTVHSLILIKTLTIQGF